MRGAHFSPDKSAFCQTTSDHRQCLVTIESTSNLLWQGHDVHEELTLVPVNVSRASSDSPQRVWERPGISLIVKWYQRNNFQALILCKGLLIPAVNSDNRMTSGTWRAVRKSVSLCSRRRHNEYYQCNGSQSKTIYPYRWNCRFSSASHNHRQKRKCSARLWRRLECNETLYLLSEPGMRESIKEGMEQDLLECLKELDWWRGK